MREKKAFSMKSDFGFNPREAPEKTTAVQKIFGRIAGRYDLMNDAMSLGLHRCWKDQFVAELPLENLVSGKVPGAFLDMATGTGDIADRLFKRTQQLQEERTFILCDLNFPMLQEGQKRHSHQPFTWICGNAETLPLPDHAVALYTIAFGLRNVTDKRKALHEAFRVIAPHGFFYCLEFSEPLYPWIQGLYDLYSFGWIPFLGTLLANDRQAYQYLVESIRTFPNPSLLETLIQEAGFQNTGFQPLAQGLVAIHWGQKI